MTFSDEPEVEYIILCDHVQILQNKLYAMGGGWSDCYMPAPESSVALNCAVAVLVPWNCTNQDYAMVLTVETPDGVEISRATARIHQGRPTNAWVGAPQRLTFSTTLFATLPTFGGYHIVGRIEGTEASKRIGFRVLSP